MIKRCVLFNHPIQFFTFISVQILGFRFIVKPVDKFFCRIIAVCDRKKEKKREKKETRKKKKGEKSEGAVPLKPTNLFSLISRLSRSLPLQNTESKGGRDLCCYCSNTSSSLFFLESHYWVSLWISISERMDCNWISINWKTHFEATHLLLFHFRCWLFFSPSVSHYLFFFPLARRHCVS